MSIAAEGLMKIIAKVFDYEISSIELNREIEKLKASSFDKSDEQLGQNALSRVIDRYLLLHEADCMHICACDEEYESALMDILDMIDPHENIEDALALHGMQANQIENLIRNKIIIKKYLNTLCCSDSPIDEQTLSKFYESQKDFFFRDEEVRASHILIRGASDESKVKILEIRSSIHSPEDFIRHSNTCSDCPTNVKCGDLGFFPRGVLLKEMEDIAFQLRINEISEPFLTKYGYHILMLTDRREKGVVPLDEIKDSLRARLVHIEKEYCLTRHLNKLRQDHAAQIFIFES